MWQAERSKMKKVKRIVLGEGYYDHADSRHNLMLWKKPLDSKELRSRRVKFPWYEKFDGKKIRLIAEVIDEKG